MAVAVIQKLQLPKVSILIQTFTLGNLRLFAFTNIRPTCVLYQHDNNILHLECRGTRPLKVPTAPREVNIALCLETPVSSGERKAKREEMTAASSYTLRSCSTVAWPSFTRKNITPLFYSQQIHFCCNRKDWGSHQSGPMKAILATWQVPEGHTSSA